MAVGPFHWPTMHVVKGLRLGVACAQIKSTQSTREDLVLFEFAEGAVASGIFTQNAFCAAPVTVGKKHLLDGRARYFVINSGNANACTGEQGLQDALTTCANVAHLGSVNQSEVIPFSTGVIGEFLPVDRLTKALPLAQADLSEDGWERAAKAIMTTDTRPKGASISFDYQGETISVTGISKGAGMIRPNMATMLAFIATDAPVAKDVLDDLCLRAGNQSFNRISIDGDTSTNDACMLVATGQANVPGIDSADGDLYRLLENAVITVFQDLAQSIVRDGEGATKFVTVTVDGGKTHQETLAVAYSIAHSPLVKTALFASDPNWGRIVCAIGYAGISDLDPSKVNVWLNQVKIVENGCRASSYREEQGVAVVTQAEFVIHVTLGRGSASDTLWTSDLSHDYVKINAEYRT